MKKKNGQKYQTEEQMEIKKFLLVLFGLIIIIIGIYFFTRAFVTKDLFKKESEITYTDGKINYDVVVVGTMLNRNNSEYYVMAFSNEDNDATYYNTLVAKYKSKEKAKQVYYLDLENELNKKYVAQEQEEASNSFKRIQDLKLGKITLLKIKDGKVEKFITNPDEIKKEWNIEK